jgi:succinate dehydrogenase / fumarate reductase cytochrome b subunit
MSSYSLHYSTLTKKAIMAVVGLFLITFLFIHLGINLTLLIPGTESTADREIFNKAAHFMTTFFVMQILEVVLFAGFLIHIIFGFIIQIQNWMARPQRYKVEGWSHTSVFSKFMIHTGIVILIFLVIHLMDFYVKAKLLGDVPNVTYDGNTIHDLGALIVLKFKNGWFVIGYIVAFLMLAFHLDHAFQSAFQSLGLNHSKYMPFLKRLSDVIAILLGIGFTVIPLVIYFSKSIQV